MEDIQQDAPVPNTDVVFARRVREFRGKARLTQSQLADQMTARGYRMHQTTMAKIESGERPVLIGEAVEVASILGVKLTDLVTAPASFAKEEREITELKLEVRALETEKRRREAYWREAEYSFYNARNQLDDARQRLRQLTEGSDE